MKAGLLPEKQRILIGKKRIGSKQNYGKFQKENTSEYLKLTGASTVFTAVGMAKTSHGLGFYNRNDGNREKMKT